MNLPGNPSLTAFVIASTVLALHLLALALYTGAVRTKAKVSVNPEDLSTVLKGGRVAEEDAPEVKRVQRAHRNATENFLPFLAVGYLYALTAPSPRAAKIYFATFVVARLLHSVVYLRGLQPWRTVMFTVGLLATLGMGVHVLRVAFAAF